MKNIPFKNVSITGGFWKQRQVVNRETTIPTAFKQCKDTGRLDAWKLQWKPGMPNQPHVYWDSDVAKLIEAIGYSLGQFPDPKLEAKADEVIDWMAAAQMPDGYLNSHFISVEPEKRWTNLRDNHELYCAGHLMEAAVAYYQGTGKRKLLDVVCKYADTIATVFGTAPGQKRGYPGHEEIELALVKLADATGNKKYLDLAKYFIDERGKKPHYFDIERELRGEPPRHVHGEVIPYDCMQAHLPVREQKTAEGHAVRACYLYAGMAAVARETKDESLIQACNTLWNNITTKRMYIHGGVGSSKIGERFTFDYDLPNENAYAETCAAIALAFFAKNMMLLDADSHYADVLERGLYNNIISGMSLSGNQFFYGNLLGATPPDYKFKNQGAPHRQDWFGCACCPPNVARITADLASYLYTQTDDTLWIHLFAQAHATLQLNRAEISIQSRTDYPWDENVSYVFSMDKPTTFTIAVRLPGWCRNPQVDINDEPVDLPPIVKKGYAYITRTWKSGDTLDLFLPMPVERIYAHPSVRFDCGRVALQRGPVVYCLEEADNGKDLNAIRLPRDAEFSLEQAPEELLQAPMIITTALRLSPDGWEGKLYSAEPPSNTPCKITAIPYFLWANRAIGEMLIWIHE